MGQKRMTLYLLFWLLHKHFFPSSMTEVRPECRLPRTAHSQHASFRLRCVVSTGCTDRAKSPGALSCAASITAGSTGRGGQSRRVTLEAIWQLQKTANRLMRYLAFTVSVLLLCMKSTASKVYRGENKRLFLLWLLLLFCTTAQMRKLGTFCKEKFVSLFLWPN